MTNTTPDPNNGHHQTNKQPSDQRTAYAKWFKTVVLLGVGVNLALSIPTLFIPAQMLDLLGLPETLPLIWVQFAANLLILLSLFYIPAALDPDQYRANAWLAVFARIAGFLFFMTQAKDYHLLGLIDLGFAIPEGILLALYIQGPVLVGAIALSITLLLGGGGFVVWSHLFREVPVYYESPADHFKYGSIGAENEEGVPYWIWMMLPRLFPNYLPGPGGYASLGITWEEGHEMPVGFTKKTVGFPRVAINCATCHVATYRKTPDAVPTLIPTGPSNTFDLQGYIRFLSDCASDPRFNSGYLLDAIAYETNLSVVDKLLYQFVIIPQTKKALLQQKETFAWMDSRPNWGRGRIDPFNPIKFDELEQPLDNTIGNSDMMAIWNHKAHQGLDLHWDGLTTSLRESVLSSAVGDGASLKSIDLEGLDRVEQFITEIDPPAFPFTIDPDLADQGQPIFDANCASCHAFGGERTGTVIPIDEIGSDRHRLDMWTQGAADAYNAYAEDYDWDFNAFQKTNGYVAVPLDGLWLKAPYLHNGSVPYLADLLEMPEDRTPVFYRGYDVYDPDQVGFVTAGPEAETIGFRYDTAVEGNSNQGHEYGIDLSTEDKQALIEYLKTL